MADRGFSIQEHCAIKGVLSNPPAEKNSDQFCNSDVAANFDIRSCKIHIERFIGRSQRLDYFKCGMAIAKNLTYFHLYGSQYVIL